MNYQFERVVSSDEQIKKLYELLNKRNHVISHKSSPSFEKHSDFVKNHPYLHWFLVSYDINYYGSFYLKKDNSVGLNLTEYNKEILVACLNFIKDNFRPQAAKPSKIPEYFYINLSYSNMEGVNTLKQLGLTPLQISLKL
jgi:hypothetical protein